MFKRITAMFLVFTLAMGLAVLAGPVTADRVSAQGPVTILRFEIGNPVFTVNGVPNYSADGIPPYIDAAYERTMMPLRTIAEAMGAQVNWNDETRTVSINRAGQYISLRADAPLPEGMGMPSIVDDRVFVPIYYVAESFGASTQWDPVAEAVYITDTFAAAPVVPVPPVTLPDIYFPSHFEKTVFELTNAERVRNGLEPVTFDENLSGVAREHSRDMAQNNIYGHLGSDGSTPADRILRSVAHMRFVAENISAGTYSAERAVEAWLLSPADQTHILDPNVTHMGVGFVNFPGSQHTYYVTQLLTIYEYTPEPPPVPAYPGSDSAFEDEVRRLINERRDDYSDRLDNLRSDSDLDRYAGRRAGDMENGRDLDPLREREIRSRLRDYSHNYDEGELEESTRRGLNLTPEQVVDYWMDNSRDRNNILDNSITHIGVGVEYRGSGADREVYVIAVFGERSYGERYQVTVNGSRLNPGAGPNRSGASYYRAGDNVTIRAGSRDGYTFGGWEVDRGNVSLNDRYSAVTTFRMPSNDVTVTATWTPGAEYDPWLTIQNNPPAEIGNQTASQSFAAGSLVTVRAGAMDGYEFTHWSGSVDFTNPYEVNTQFTMPSSSTTITANWQLLPGEPTPEPAPDPRD